MTYGPEDHQWPLSCRKFCPFWVKKENKITPYVCIMSLFNKSVYLMYMT